ncbi:UNVERIFIED_CONTAM: hypothetical protein FKN15_059800 [Acipenser sinensis]
MTDTILSNGHTENNVVDSGYFKKGCNPFAQTGRSKLQNERASLNQQIIKEMRMRAGAENLLRATTNNKVREMAVLELSYVNSNLQLLMEHLEGLNSSVEVYQNVEETSSLPLIPLGLKETKEADFSVPFKDFILEHYSEDGSNYEDTIADLMDLRQAVVNQIVVNTLRYDSFTGVPVCQQNIALEKASILFNTGALYTQIATRCNRQNRSGLESAIDAFQKAAGTLNHLKETFTHTPSYDLSPAMLSVLTRMMLAQAQECVFDKIALPGIKNEYFCLCRMAQEAAKVCDVYSLVYQSMIQTPVKDHVPFFWSAMAQVKMNHYRALAHYFVATALLDHELCPNDDEDKQEKALFQLYDSMPDGMSSLKILKSKDDRKHLGKAHLRKAILDHEEALRIHNLCRHVKKLDILQEILQAGHKRSLNKYSEFDSENDFVDFIEAPQIIAKTEQKAEMAEPSSSKVKVTDFFQKLGPLALFSAKQRWTAPRGVHITLEEGDLGFTLKGDAPVQIQSLDPLSPAAIEGVKEGDYIVSIQDTDCKWLGVSEVMKMLKSGGDEGVDIQVISLMENTVSSMSNKSATYCGGLPKTYSMICLAMDDDKIGKTQKVTKKLAFLSWGNKNKQKTASTISLPLAIANTLPTKNRLSTAFSNTDSSLY